MAHMATDNTDERFGDETDMKCADTARKIQSQDVLRPNPSFDAEIRTETDSLAQNPSI